MADGKTEAKIQEAADKFVDELNKKKELSPSQRQERFCQLYATDETFFANGVQAYLEVYDIDKSKPNWYKTACVCASKLLSNAKVYNRINELLEEGGLNDEFVDKQLLFLINQQTDFRAKLGAMKEYNALKKRITSKLDLTTDGQPITIVRYEQPAKENTI